MPDNMYIDAQKTSPRFMTDGAAYYTNGILFFAPHWSDDEEISFGVKIYGNYDGETTPDMADNPLIEWHSDEDLVFEQEKERLRKDRDFEAYMTENGVLSPDGKTLVCESDQEEFGNVGTIVKYMDGKKPPFETSEWYPWNYYWLDDRYVIFNQYKAEHTILDTQTKHIFFRQLYPDISADGFTRTPISGVDRNSKTIFLNCQDNVADKSWDVKVNYTYDKYGFPVLSSDNAEIRNLNLYGDFYIWLNGQYLIFMDEKGRTKIFDFENDLFYSISVPGFDEDFFDYINTEEDKNIINFNSEEEKIELNYSFDKKGFPVITYKNQNIRLEKTGDKK